VPISSYGWAVAFCTAVFHREILHIFFHTPPRFCFPYRAMSFPPSFLGPPFPFPARLYSNRLSLIPWQIFCRFTYPRVSPHLRRLVPSFFFSFPPWDWGNLSIDPPLRTYLHHLSSLLKFSGVVFPPLFFERVFWPQQDPARFSLLSFTTPPGSIATI